MHDDEADLQPLDVARPWAPAESRVGRAFRVGPAVAALVVTMLIAGVAGFAVTSQLRSGKDFNRAVAIPPPASDPDEAALGDLNVQQSDVTSGFIVGLIPNGGSVSGATLDLCNGSFPSEKLRTARRQVAAVDITGPLALSTEAVLYRHPADSAQAFRELRALHRSCPNSPVTSPTGGRTLTTRFGASPDRLWKTVANVERIAFDVNTTDGAGQRDHTVAVYLRRGRALIGVYFGSAAATQPMVAGETTLEGITRIFALRMAELPTSVVDG